MLPENIDSNIDLEGDYGKILPCNMEQHGLGSLPISISRFTDLPPSQPGKDPGRGRKSAESVEGSMDCQSF